MFLVFSSSGLRASGMGCMIEGLGMKRRGSSGFGLRVLGFGS